MINCRNAWYRMFRHADIYAVRPYTFNDIGSPQLNPNFSEATKNNYKKLPTFTHKQMFSRVKSEITHRTSKLPTQNGQLAAPALYRRPTSKYLGITRCRRQT